MPSPVQPERELGEYRLFWDMGDPRGHCCGDVVWDPSLSVLEQTLDLGKTEKEPREALGEEGTGMLSSR